MEDELPFLEEQIKYLKEELSQMAESEVTAEEV
jgi:hypothetical protein